MTRIYLEGTRAQLDAILKQLAETGEAEIGSADSIALNEIEDYDEPGVYIVEDQR